MLYRIEAENFYSIRDPAVLDLRVARNVVDRSGKFEPIFPGADERAPKVVALFGPNASGKSTVLKVLAFLARFATDSFHAQPGSPIPCERFNDDESAARPIRLAAEFGGPMQLVEPATPAGQTEMGTYRYELHVAVERGLPRGVLLEALRHRPAGTGKWIRVFERRADRRVEAGKAFVLSGYRNVIDKVRPNASLISTLAQFEHGPSLFLQRVVSHTHTNILLDRFEPQDRTLMSWYANKPPMVEALNRELERIDLGIKSMQLAGGNDGPAASFEHHGLTLPMPWLLESYGTKSFIRIYPYIALSLESGGIAIVDELDTAIHPTVLPEILRWYADKSRNPLGAQLWMTCHHASLLEELEKEEVYFCEKDASGRTKVFGLKDVQAVRRVDNLYRKYLSGVYGAVPRIG